MPRTDPERLAQLDAALLERGLDPTLSIGGKADGGAGHMALEDRQQSVSMSGWLRSQYQARAADREKVKRMDVPDATRIPDDAVAAVSYPEVPWEAES